MFIDRGAHTRAEGCERFDRPNIRLLLADDGHAIIGVEPVVEPARAALTAARDAAVVALAHHDNSQKIDVGLAEECHECGVLILVTEEPLPVVLTLDGRLLCRGLEGSDSPSSKHIFVSQRLRCHRTMILS